MRARFYWLAAVAMGLATLPGCFANEPTSDELEWVIVNHTADTLLVTVRFPLDSVLINKGSALLTARGKRTRDSLNATPTLLSPGDPTSDYLQQPCWLVQHRGRWYLAGYGLVWQHATPGVLYQQEWVNPLLDGWPTWRRAHLDSNTHLITYQLPPRSRQRLCATPLSLAGSELPPAMHGLWLRQGALRRAVPLGPALPHLFQPQPPAHKTDFVAHHSRQLTVGPGLALNE